MAPESPNFDFSRLELPRLDTDKLVEAVRDAAYITVGLGVLAFEKVQELRKDLVDQLTDQRNEPVAGRKAQAEELKAKVERYVSELDARITALESRLDSAVEELEGRLPEQAGALLGQAHDLAKSARKQVRDLVRKAS